MEKLLSLLNGWWTEGEVPEELAKPYVREPFARILELLKYKQMVLLTGLRRVGKSTLMFQTIRHLLREGIPPRHLLYFSFDERVSDPLQVLDLYSNLTGVDWRRERIYVFLDEVQKLPGWASKLKLLYDSCPNLKLFLSGSGGPMLEREASSDLAGRYFSVRVGPLSLREFFEMSTGRRVEGELKLWEPEMGRFLERFMERPFPEVVGWEERRKVEEYLGESVLEKVVRKDLPQVFQGVNQEALMRMLESFYSSPGMYLSPDSLARSLRMSKKNLLRHLSYLEFSCLIRVVRNYRPSLLVASRKLKRVYPYHWALVWGLHLEVERGKLLESIVSSLLEAEYYWREGPKEVDFLLREEGRVIPVEVKTGEVEAGELKGMRHFMRSYGAGRGYVIYPGTEGRVWEFEEGRIELVPLLKVCLYGRALFSKPLPSEP
ncbi:MAG: ATP-binding protein [Candidatus Hadarchaeales archaeon]